MKAALKQDSRTAMLETGMNIMLEKGYTNTGIQEILSALGIPKGSFYHYFDSKENYAVEVIRHYEQKYTAELEQVLSDAARSPLARLRHLCESGKARLSTQDWRKGCLIGNLGQEMSDQSEILRRELSIIITKWRRMIASCILEGQQVGEIKQCWNADALAELFQCGWMGAVLRAKTVKNAESIDVFIDLMFKDVLKS